MDQRIYHGVFSPSDLARSLIAHFNRGNYQVQQIGQGDQVAVQIATTRQASAGGATALSVNLLKVEDGVSVQLSNQAWFGVAASLGWTAIAAIQNPFNLLGRLDDIAQDIENIQLSEEVWSVIDGTARASGTGFELTERLRRSVCPYCNTANPVGEANCIACGAPLGDIQPETCPACGFVLSQTDKVCPNCGKPITSFQPTNPG
jgi:DNA-directed RNA polymerase subunit RPC12/RpoP